MNILYIAYSCNPYNGSEDKIGWSVPFESAKSNKVFVITKSEQREFINKYLMENKLKNIEFCFVDIPAIYKRVFNGFMYSGRLNIWNRRAFYVAKKICKDENIEIVHQITPIEFRAIGNYGKISNIKFVCGPLGGGEKLPNELQFYVKGHRLIEWTRTVINYWYRLFFSINKKLKNCDYIMFANEETQKFLRMDKNNVKLFFDNGLKSEELLDIEKRPISEIAIEEFQLLARTKEHVTRKIVFLVVGRLIYRKGHRFLFDALAKVPTYLKYEVRIVGDGEEKNRIIKMISEDTNLSEHVTFVGAVPYLEVEKEYLRADVLIMPSIRETTGTVLLEAMAKGIPVITKNRFGGAVLFDEETAFLYEGTDRDSFIKALSDQIIFCINNPQEVYRRGKNAREKAKKYTWSKKNQHYQEIYKSLLQQVKDEVK